MALPRCRHFINPLLILNWQRQRAIDRWLMMGASGLLIFILASPTEAQPNPTLKVATRIVPPFVMQEEGRLVGFSVELWQSIADEIGLKSEFLVQPDVTQLLNSVKSGQAQLGIAAVSITSDRYANFDFSQPIFESGLQILVRDDAINHASSPNIVNVLFSPTLLKIIGIMILIILIPAHFVWFFERHHSNGMIRSKAYFPGIFQACWWAAATLATQADEMPKSIASRLMAVLWMFTSVVFVAYFTATVTASLTVQQLQGAIRGPEDLPGKRVATITGSTSATYLDRHNAEVSKFIHIEDAYKALLNHQVDAVVFDAPVILYYAAHAGKGKVHIVGNPFRRESYAIVFPPNSPYEKAINEALLSLQEKGQYQEIYDKWFTNSSVKR